MTTDKQRSLRLGFKVVVVVVVDDVVVYPKYICSTANTSSSGDGLPFRRSSPR